MSHEKAKNYLDQVHAKSKEFDEKDMLQMSEFNQKKKTST